MNAIHRENSLKYSFLDLSSFNNNLRVGWTWFQCFCYHESSGYNQTHRYSPRTVWYKNLCGYQSYTVFIRTV